MVDWPESFPLSEQSQDLFLGGRMRLSQPRYGYRAAADPVLLAAACPAKSGDLVLELGCGVGVASLCLASRVAGAEVHGLELQPAYAALARHNAEITGLNFTVHQGDLRQMPVALRGSFDQVIANPPYFTADGGTAAENAGREFAQREATALRDWCAAARKRLHPGGWFTMINSADRLGDILAGLEGFGAVAVLPLAPRAGRAANRVIVRARKSAKGAFRLLAPLVMHDGARHEGDRDSYSAEVAAILRDGAPLERF